MSTKLYDPSQVVITVGPNLITGTAEGTFVKISRDEDAFFKKVGSDGEVARARNKNRSGSVEITLQQSSASCDVLDALRQADELTGTGAVPLLVKDLLGTTLASAQNCWVKKMPDTEFAKEIGARAFVLDCDLLSGNVGGSNVGP